MKRKSKKVKNFILYAITYLAMVLYMFSFLAVGIGLTEYKPLLISSMVWLGLFALSNGLLEIIKDGWDR